MKYWKWHIYIDNICTNTNIYSKQISVKKFTWLWIIAYDPGKDGQNCIFFFWTFFWNFFFTFFLNFFLNFCWNFVLWTFFKLFWHQTFPSFKSDPVVEIWENINLRFYSYGLEDLILYSKYVFLPKYLLTNYVYLKFK